MITAVLLLVMGALVFLHRIGPQEDASPIVVLEVTEQVQSGQAEVVSADHVTLYVPANAILQDGTISIKRLEPDQVPGSDDIWTRPIVVLIQFIDAEGQPVPDVRFLNRLEVCFLLSEDEWADSVQRPTSYQVQFYPPGETPAYWDVLLMSSHAENRELCGLTTRLGMFALAIELEPEIPITGLTQAVLPATLSSDQNNDSGPAPTRERERPTSTPVPASTSTPQPPTDTSLPPPTDTEPPPPPATARPPDPGPPTDAPRPPDPGPPTDAPRPPDPGPPTDKPGPPNGGGPPTDRPGPPNGGGPPTNPGRP